MVFLIFSSYLGDRRGYEVSAVSALRMKPRCMSNGEANQEKIYITGWNHKHCLIMIGNTAMNTTNFKSKL